MAEQNTAFELETTVGNEYTDLSFGPYDHKCETVSSNTAKRCFKPSELEPTEGKDYFELSGLPDEHVYHKLTSNIAESTFKPLETKSVGSKDDMYSGLCMLSDDHVYSKIFSKHSENSVSNFLFRTDKRKILFLCTGVIVVIIVACVAAAVVLTSSQDDQSAVVVSEASKDSDNDEKQGSTTQPPSTSTGTTVTSDCSQTCAVGTLNTACDTCICEGVTVNGRVMADDTGYPIGNAGIYARSAPMTLLALSDAIGNFTLNSSCLTTELFLLRTGFQETVVENAQTYQEIKMKKIVRPYLTQQPQPRSRLLGESVMFCCSAVAEPEVTYFEWMKDSVILESSNKSMVTINSLSLHDQGNYQCRANSPAGAIMSQAVRLEIKESTDAFCANALHQKTIALPEDCIQPDTNTATFEVGECVATACRKNGSSDTLSCQDDVKSRCFTAEADLVKVQCSGYELEVVVVRSCGCAADTSNDLTIAGYALALNDRDPVKFAEVWVNGEYNTYTAADGSFSFQVSEFTPKISINVQDNFLRQFLPTVKVVTITDLMSGTLNVDILMIRKAEPVLIDSTVENTLFAGASSENASIPIVQMSIPPNAFYYPGGTPFSGTAQASLTFLDPKNSTVLQNIPGVFEFVDEEGQTGNLASLGVFNLYFTDEKGEPLILDEVIDLFLPPDVDIGGEELKLWKLNPESGIWEYVTANTGTRRRKRQETAQWIGELDWSKVSEQYWYNYDKIYDRSENPCYFKVRLFQDKNLTESVPYPNRLTLLDFHIFKQNVITTFTNYIFFPEEECMTGICEDDKAYMSLYFHGSWGLHEMFVGDPEIGSESIDYKITDDSKVLKITMTSSDNGPFYNNKTVCIASIVSKPHLKYYFEETSREFTLLPFFDFSPRSDNFTKNMSMRTWYPMRPLEKYRTCFLKVRVIFDQYTYLYPGQSIKVKVTSFGGTHTNIHGVLLGIRENKIQNVSDASSFCMEYKCSGSIDPIFSSNGTVFDYTKVNTEIDYRKTDVRCVVSNTADFVSKTGLNSYQNATESGSYEFYAPTSYSPDIGLYSATSSSRPQKPIENSATRECQSGTTHEVNGYNPEKGVGVTFSCGPYWRYG